MNFANINIGTTPDDHTGDTLRVAFAKINQNFANVAAAGGAGVNTVAGRAGNVILSVNDVIGAVSIGALPSLVATALGDISVPTTSDMSAAIAVALSSAEAYADSAVANLSLNAPAGLQTIKQLADAIGDDPVFYQQVNNIRNGLNLANAQIITNTNDITSLWSNISVRAVNDTTNTSSINQINANVAAANATILTNTTNIGTVSAGLNAANVIIGSNTTGINLLNANVTAANLAISSLQSNAASQESEIASHTASIASLNTGLSLANASIATNTSQVSAINANVTAANLAISALQSNAISQESRIQADITNIGLLNANVAGANAAIATLQSTTATHTTQIAQVNANVTAANTAITNLQNAGYATTSYVSTQINNLVNGAPGTLDTLKEIADAIGDDAQFTSHYVNTVTAINANVTAANSSITLLGGTVATLNTDINNITNQLATGNIITTGNMGATKFIVNGGIFWSNGTPFVSGSNQAVNTGNIAFSGYTISTINDTGGNFGITLNPANGGEVHINTNTGINNTNPAYWLEVGNQSTNNTGAIGVDFSNGAGYNSSAVWTWDWDDGTISGTKKAVTGLYVNGDIAKGLITFDVANTPANAIVVNGDGINTGNINASYLELSHVVSANNAVVAPGLTSFVNPGFPLYVSLNNTTRVYSAQSLNDTIAKFVGTDTGNALVSIDGYNASTLTGPGFETRSARGNISIPATVQTGDILGRYGARGYGATRFPLAIIGGMNIIADGTYSDSSFPTALSFFTTQPGNVAGKQAMRISSTSNVIITGGTSSTSTNTGALIVQGGMGVTGNINARSVSANAFSTITSTATSSITGTLLVQAGDHSNDPASGALTVPYGGVGVGGNLNVAGMFSAGQSTINGSLTVNSSLDPMNYEGGALHVQGGAVIDGNVQIGNQLLIGNTVVSHQLTNAVINARISSQSGAGIQYAQAALTNTSASGSTDWIAYADDYPGPQNDHGWMDVGYTGSAFNDPLYTITKSNDGYIFAGAVANSGLGGNLVLATDNTGTHNDIIFATGSFYSNAEVARFHGNTSTGGSFNVKTDLVVGGNLTVTGSTSFGSTRTNIAITTTTLAPNANATVIATGYKGYALYAIQTSTNAWVTMYNSNISASNDIGRTISTDPTVNGGVVAEIITTNNTPYYFTPAVYGYTVDGTAGIPLRVNNQSGSSQTITVTMTMLKLEN